VRPRPARREAALNAAKAEASRDWTPEYSPPSMLPERFKKGQLLRKAASVSPAMILTVSACLRALLQGNPLGCAEGPCTCSHAQPGVALQTEVQR
jgi:hypothetical protein